MDTSKGPSTSGGREGGGGRGGRRKGKEEGEGGRGRRKGRRKEEGGRGRGRRKGKRKEEGEEEGGEREFGDGKRRGMGMKRRTERVLPGARDVFGARYGGGRFGTFVIDVGVHLGGKCWICYGLWVPKRS